MSLPQKHSPHHPNHVWPLETSQNRIANSEIPNSIESWPFKVIDQEGSPMVEVEYLGENKVFSPQEISSMVLTKVIWFLHRKKKFLN